MTTRPTRISNQARAILDKYGTNPSSAITKMESLIRSLEAKELQEATPLQKEATKCSFTDEFKREIDRLIKQDGSLTRDLIREVAR